MAVLWAALLLTAGCAKPPAEQNQGVQFPRAYDDHPDLSGIWQAIGAGSGLALSMWMVRLASATP